ncbi:hypothetical protein BLD44_023160 [Mastigocladus laminosus UU774]|nr:hypothetical protein BLD44_023160 [Mastigocladus laminosus UU774]
MSTITKFEKKDVQGIEFYVSNDGKSSGMSQLGLARLCGVDVASLRTKTLNVFADGAKTASEALKPILDKNIWVDHPAPNNAKIVSPEACACIIEYYVFESKARSQQALEAYRQFAKVGIHTWILHTTGFTSTVTSQPVEPMPALNEVLVGLYRPH